MYYLCSIGSNIDPEEHVARVVKELVTRFGRVTLSPFTYTSPVGMDSEHRFINALFLFYSKDTEAEVKQGFNLLEAVHGRDRADQLSSVKDRTLDLDILQTSPTPDFSQPEESYLQGLAAHLLEQQALPPGTEFADIRLGALKFGHRTATIDLDPSAGHIVVVD
ncbi:2-amino-4-hydroxy-6-hydroxymethyldihydropteridine diphosphokinase [Corallincola platygyrae]|uniref:2-amino-4-hydroxy-6-hydroxymethyldihydropteridine pyrophosphokinase n=1 Tax=Corallincola platygyrae TaxID=1193278 RepID=A0ABW4XPG1_9GAMM